MINVYHLKYFSDACRAENMSEAARQNHVTHSAVSQAIRSLEENFDVKLVRHAKKHFELTNEGRALFQRAESLFNEIEHLSNLTKSSATETGGALKLGLSHSIGLGLVSAPLAAFAKSHPLVMPDVSIGNSDTLSTLLKSRSIEIGFGIDDGSFPSFERRKLSSGRFVLAKSPRLSNVKRFIVGDKGLEVRQLLLALPANAATTTVQSWAIAADLARRGAGVALLPDFMMDRLIVDREFESIKLPRYELFAFYRSRSALSRGAVAFLETFKA